MAIFFDAPVEPDALTAFVREVPTPSTLGLTTRFPRRNTDDNTIDFSEVLRTNRTAMYRSFDGRIHVSDRDTTSDRRVKLLPLSSSLGMGEYERLQLEFARTGGNRREALANAIYNDAERLTREVQNRLELAWGDVLLDGKLTINENGFAGEADFGVPGNHIVTASTAWTSTSSAAALDNLIAWADAYNATNGFLPGSILTSQRVQRLLQQNAQIIAATSGNTGRNRITLPELNDVLSSEGLPTIGSTYGTKLNVDGTTTSVLPDDRLIFLPPNIADLGYTAYGVSATALELMNSNSSDLAFEQAPGIVGVVIKDGPPFRQYTYVDAVAMPILANAKLLFVADVA